YIHILDPEKVSYGLGLAKGLRLTGKIDQARSLGERLLSLSPKDGSIHLELGEIALASGEKEAAVQFAKAAGESGFHLLSRTYLAFGNREEANRVLQQAWENDPGNTQIFIRLWRGLVEHREFSLAEKLSRDRITRKPLERKGWLLLGQALHAQGDYLKAISVFKKAITLGGPGFDRARVYLRVCESREKGGSPLSNIRERDMKFAYELEPELRRTHP
ncbi:MAG: tetratricopeptide repeat protein, partial [Planctomycetota bacterium]|nr:tetratricopeptide repeat protein [Planctomycetota bacterium]